MTVEPVLLLHGQPGRGRQWSRVRAALAELTRPEDRNALASDTVVLAPDRPGYGDNLEPAGGFFDNACWAAGELERAGVTHATVVGHSWGGGVALALAQTAPEMVNHLVLVCSVGPECLMWMDPIAANRTLEKFTAAAARLVGQERTVRSAFLEQRKLFEELPALTHDLGSIVAPTDVIRAGWDLQIPRRTADELVRRIPRTRLHAVPRGTHEAIRHAPGAIARIIHTARTASAMGAD